MYGFEQGRLYNRRKDIHERFAGQQQGGIITPSQHSLVIIVTGDSGHQHGYTDRTRSDGIFEYFGEGQVGDMEFIRGNAAIRDHAAKGKDLLLFRKERQGLRYDGAWHCAGYHYEQAPDRNGNMRRAIVFELARDGAVAAVTTADTDIDVDTLRERAFAAAKTEVSAKAAVRNVYQRSADVAAYVVQRAAGKCEGCASPAPFVRPSGVPYLEPHHIRRVSDGGPDDPRFVIGLCPTCHRRVHHGIDGPTYNTSLLEKMKAIEP